MMKTVSLRNHSIDIIRYFCAILVVTIHTAPFRQSCYGAYYVLTQFIARIGVPFFVCGYLILKIQQREPKYLTGTNCKWALAGAVALWVCEFLVLHIMKWNGHMSISLGMYPVVVTLILSALQYPLPSYQNLSEKCRVLADLHTMHILWLFYIWKRQARRFTGLHMVCPCFL